MTEFWIYLALTAIQILATKTQPGPKAAKLADVDVPVAEEGRELAVVFGRVRLKDFNVVWHGDFLSYAIKKRMGFKKQLIAYDYFIKAHLALCHGPVNKAGRATYNKTLLKNSTTNNAMADIPLGGLSRPTIGLDRQLINGVLQGGTTYIGRVRYNAGFDDQAVPSQWKDRPDNNAYRGVLTADLYQEGGKGANFTGKRGFYMGQQPRVLLMTHDVERTDAGWFADEVWYPEKLEIARAAPEGYVEYNDFNPAHMIYEAITNPRWGMGGAAALIDDTNFRAAADQLHAEALGLSLEWAKEQTIGQFVDSVCDHIRGGIRFNESLGKFQLMLWRDDYELEDLPVFNPGNSTLLRYAASGNLERVNEVSLNYTDPRTFDLATITAQDMGAQLAQGAAIPVTVAMPGITNGDTAKMLLGWELHARVAPLSTIQISLNRGARGLGSAGVFFYQEPTHHAGGRVYRATKVSNSPVDRNEIIVDAVADIFAQQVEGWTVGEPQLPDEGLPNDDTEDPDESDSGTAVVSTGTTTPPVTPEAGGTYVPGPGATGAWAGHDGDFAEFVPGTGEGGGEWTFEPVPDHTFVYDETLNEWYEYVGGIRYAAPWIPHEATTKGDLIVYDGTHYQRLPAGVDGRALIADAAETLGLRYKALTAATLAMRGATWVRSGSAVAVPTNVVYVHCPVAGQILKVVLTTGPAGTSGSCVVDIWKSSTYPPTVANTITAASKPTIAGSTHYVDLALTGWTTTVNAGDWLAFNLDSSSLFRFVSAQLFIVQAAAVS